MYPNGPHEHYRLFSLYQGKDKKKDPVGYSKCLGKAAAPFVKLIDQLPATKEEYLYNFYFVNLFTSVILFKCLRSCGFVATGTMRSNRVPKREYSSPMDSNRCEEQSEVEYKQETNFLIQKCFPGDHCTNFAEKWGQYYLAHLAHLDFKRSLAQYFLSAYATLTLKPRPSLAHWHIRQK